MKKTLIEKPSVELLELFSKVSDEAKKEKLVIPPINKVVYYWTRKPLVVGEFVALCSTLDNIDDVRKILDISGDGHAYKRPPRVDLYEKSLGQKPGTFSILDPFGGAGSLIFSAKRLELDCSISDYNPYAYLIERSMLEYPVKYKKKLVEDFEMYADKLINMTKQEVGKFYDTSDIVYFWVWCVKCPHCKQRVPLTNHMWLANTKKNKIGVRFKSVNKDFTVKVVKNMKDEEGNRFIQKHGKGLCIDCGGAISNDEKRNGMARNRDLAMIAKSTRTKSGKHYNVLSDMDYRLFSSASKLLSKKYDEFDKLGILPTEEVRPSHRDNLRPYGINKWYQYYNDRQLLVLLTLIKNIRKISVDIPDKKYAGVISLYLGFMVCKLASQNCFGTLFDVTRESVKQVMSFRMPMVLSNYVETNPFNSGSGSLNQIKKLVSNGIKFALSDITPSIKNISVTKISQEKKYDVIITDPPYSNDVPYGELSDFFYTWLYRCVGKHYPMLPQMVPLDEDYCTSLHRFSKPEQSITFFEDGLAKSFISMNKILKDDGIMTVFFAHSDVKTWNLLLKCLRKARFRVVSSYSIHTESTSNVLAIGKTSFMSSIIIACRKISEEKTEYFQNILPDIQDEIKNMINDIPTKKLLMLPITDLLIMVYGKVLEKCTTFTELKSLEKNFEPTFETLIEGAPEHMMKLLVSKLTKQNINRIGARMAFHLLGRIFYHGIIPPDEVIKITHSLSTSRDTLENNGVATNENGSLKLIPLHDGNTDIQEEDLNGADLYQQLSYLASSCHASGTNKVSSMLSMSGDRIRVDEMKKIIPLLIKSHRIRINKGPKLDKEERNELKILETLSSLWNIATDDDSLEKYMVEK